MEIWKKRKRKGVFWIIERVNCQLIGFNDRNVLFSRTFCSIAYFHSLNNWLRVYCVSIKRFLLQISQPECINVPIAFEQVFYAQQKCFQ
jgi:hypothetical protein